MDRRSGPTGTGDDGQANPVTLPLTLSAPAPAQAGTYVWGATWFGGASSGGGAHLEVRRPLTITVVSTVAVPEEDGVVRSSWARLKRYFD